MNVDILKGSFLTCTFINDGNWQKNNDAQGWKGKRNLDIHHFYTYRTATILYRIIVYKQLTFKQQKCYWNTGFYSISKLKLRGRSDMYYCVNIFIYDINVFC